MVNNQNLDGGLRELLEKNLEVSESILEISKKIHKFIIWQQIFGVFKVLIILLPIAVGIIYFPMIKDMFSQYTNVLGQYQELLNFNASQLDSVNKMFTK